ncbi:GNAT family N-acetyltransferase [Clostridium sp. UBA1056]|uniref:GNAT family N-acetyltransferase n=1 Tax=unclassified Clostridium TaxID=2614128 RepID=UPI0032168BB3
MYTIKKLSSDQDFINLADIVSNAYPGLHVQTQEQKSTYIENAKATQQNNPVVNFYGVFKDDNLCGSMRFHDFKINLLSAEIKAGGIGLVAVDLLHKKEKIAKTILTEFINYYKNTGTSLVMLYPFRPDFYKKMGFGFGTSINQYKIKPCNLPNGSSKSNIHFIKEENIPALLECYTRVYEKTNGLLEKYELDFERIFKNPNSKVIAYKNNNSIQGYMIFEFVSGNDKNSMINDVLVNDFIFENVDALNEMMTFLNSQNDQIRYVIFNIQDEDFRFLLEDPRNDSTNLLAPVYHECSMQGTGIMYRVIDVPGIFSELKNHNFNKENCTVKITVRDDFLTTNDGSVIVNFKDGFPSLSTAEDYNVEIELDISDFSSLITCAVTFKSLYKYGRATISKAEYLDIINGIFSSCSKPICTSVF